MATAYRYVMSIDESKDILQESWIKIFQNLNNYEDRGNLLGWMKTIVIRQALKNIAKKKNELASSLTVEEGQWSTDPSVFEAMRVEEILIYINQLPNLSKLVFTLKIIDGYSHKEIAEMLDIKESTSRVHLTNARRRLGKLLKEADKIAL
jgi:RNA polymerase sigma-70 factor (ECF subfamily)